MEHSFERLKDHILLLSNSRDFDVAKNEWKLVDVSLQEDWDHCPCGQRIKELCYIHNKFNSEKTCVGNVCVNQFIGISTGNLFDGLKRIAKDNSANANEDLIIHAYKRGFIYKNEYQFLMQIHRKRKLSEKQIKWKKTINWRILSQTVVRKK